MILDVADPSPSPPAPTPARIPSLDGFRGVAVLMVMFSHFIEPSHALSPASPWQNLLLSGYVGVHMFFILSGFLISGILLDTPKSGPRYFLTFYSRRALRIFPLYYLILAIAFLFFRNPYGDSPWWYLGFASNLGDCLKGSWLNATHTVSLAHLWSLAIEEQFYLIWPLVIFLLPHQQVARTCWLLIIIAPLSCFACSLAQQPLAYYLFTLHHFNSLAAGALLAMAYRKPTIWQRCQSLAPRIALSLLPLTLIGLLFPSPPFSTLQELVSPLFWAACLVLSLTPQSRLARAFSSPLLTYPGKISYGLYLYHSFFLALAYQFLYWPSLYPLCNHHALALGLFVPIAFTLSFLIATASWFLFEKPILSLNRHCSYSQKCVSTPSSNL